MTDKLANLRDWVNAAGAAAISSPYAHRAFDPRARGSGRTRRLVMDLPGLEHDIEKTIVLVHDQAHVWYVDRMIRALRGREIRRRTQIFAVFGTTVPLLREFRGPVRIDHAVAELLPTSTVSKIVALAKAAGNTDQEMWPHSAHLRSRFGLSATFTPGTKGGIGL